jgi:formiminoglutamate deiminase
MTMWCERAVIDGEVVDGVRITASGDGLITSVERATRPADGEMRLGLVVPAFANAHSHAFHRLLRARTHADGGSFWTWRTAMYDVAGRLDPTSYRAVATAVFAEMVGAGFTAVGEFHYVHHRPDGAPYDPPHAMELALVEAADAAGVRLTLLDTCYLAASPRRPLEPQQRRFGDRDADTWLHRWYALRDVLAASGSEHVTLGAAVHSVRAVPPAAIARIGASLPDDVPLHVHLSEQPAENRASIEAFGMTPTEVLDEAGVLGRRLSVVHATHLEPTDVRRLGAAGVSVVMCPTTEADLGDGIGPARELADAGARIALGSDQHAVIDPFLEARALEHGERLAHGARGRFTPRELWDAATRGSYEAIGLRGGRLEAGMPCDLVEVDAASARTAGSDPAQVIMAATSSDVRTVVAGGRVVATGGRPLVGQPEELLMTAMEGMSRR